MGDEETAGSLRERAERLRECAREARDLCAEMDPLLDAPVETARQDEPAVWRGPYAEHTTTRLGELRRTLREMAEALDADAGRWDSHADGLDDQAAGRDSAEGAGA